MSKGIEQYGGEGGFPSMEYHFVHGRKNLILKVNFVARTFATKITTIKERKGLEDETTQVYLQAREKMQEITNKVNRPMKYDFVSKLKIMQGWALNRGGQIFEWDNIQQREHVLVARKTFFPAAGIDL